MAKSILCRVKLYIRQQIKGIYGLCVLVYLFFHLFIHYFILYFRSSNQLLLGPWLPLVENSTGSQIIHFLVAQCGVMLNNKYSRGCIDQIWQPEAPVMTNQKCFVTQKLAHRHEAAVPVAIVSQRTKQHWLTLHGKGGVATLSTTAVPKMNSMNILQRLHYGCT